MDIADAANTVTMTAGSAYAYVWDGTVDYGQKKSIIFAAS